MNTKSLLTALSASVAIVLSLPADVLSVERVFRPARLTRGNTNIVRLQPIDDASWIWAPGEAKEDFEFLKFRRAFEVEQGKEELVLDVSADERYVLTLDGAFVSRGPNRSMPSNWQYGTYRVRLTPGRHVFEATVWRTGSRGPLAQLSHRGGFVFRAEGAYDKVLTTGKATWQVGRLDGMAPNGQENGSWGTGEQWIVSGCGIETKVPAEWTDAVVVRGPAGVATVEVYGHRTPGWELYPSQLPDQLARRCRPGRVVAVARDVPWRQPHVFVAAETNITIDLSKPFVVPPRTRLQIAWDLGRYLCAYPEVTLSGGAGARFALGWTESSVRAGDGLKGAEAGARDAIVGRSLGAYGEIFLPDGRAKAVFTSPWFRCGKWCRIDIETAEAPLTVNGIDLLETRYPLEDEGGFDTPDDSSLADVRRISLRAMQMCAHEMLFDCPYYEQQMYPGDTRVQLNVLAALTGDDRLVRRAIELYDLSTGSDGMCPFNWPSRGRKGGRQEGAAYTLCYVLMYGDFAFYRADRAWLRARLPGLRKSMAGLELLEDAEGLLTDLPGWSFVDWVPEWKGGVPPNGRVGQGRSAVVNLLWLAAMHSAAKTERALGNDLQGAYWEAKAAALKEALVRVFWDEGRGLFADTPEKASFSEHVQSLALLEDVLPSQAGRVFRNLVERKDLARCTVYFSYYLFEAYFKFNRGDLFLKRLDLWRDYVKKGLTTTQEAPDVLVRGKWKESRSDCHAWGAHPIWFSQTGLAGIRSAAPFFERVSVRPSPGSLGSLSARMPHPQGAVEVDLKFAEGRAKGSVRTPVPGEFEFGSQRCVLTAGLNAIE